MAYSGEQLVNPESLTIGIALQNIPEGLTVAISLVAVGYSKFKSALYAMLTGLVQPVGALIGLLILDISDKAHSFGNGNGRRNVTLCHYK